MYVQHIGFVRATENTNAETKHIYNALQQKQLYPETSDRATIWNEKAMLLKKLSDALCTYIELLKQTLATEAEATDASATTLLSAENKTIVDNLFFTKGKGVALAEHLQAYITSVLQIDPIINAEFQHKISLGEFPGKADGKSGQNFTDFYFRESPVINAMSVLSNLQSNTRIIENNIAHFCHSHATSVLICGFNQPPHFLLSQNTSYVKAGTPIKVEMGIAVLSMPTTLDVRIGDKSIPTQADGMARYEINTKNKSGKYKLPLTATFVNQDGKKTTITDYVAYEVVGDSTKQTSQ